MIQAMSFIASCRTLPSLRLDGMKGAADLIPSLRLDTLQVRTLSDDKVTFIEWTVQWTSLDAFDLTKGLGLSLVSSLSVFCPACTTVS